MMSPRFCFFGGTLAKRHNEDGWPSFDALSLGDVLPFEQRDTHGSRQNARRSIET